MIRKNNTRTDYSKFFEKGDMVRLVSAENDRIRVVWTDGKIYLTDPTGTAYVDGDRYNQICGKFFRIKNVFPSKSTTMYTLEELVPDNLVAVPNEIEDVFTAEFLENVEFGEEFKEWTEEELVILLDSYSVRTDAATGDSWPGNSVVDTGSHDISGLC